MTKKNLKFSPDPHNVISRGGMTITISGPQGSGRTTAMRIIKKALSCEGYMICQMYEDNIRLALPGDGRKPTTGLSIPVTIKMKTISQKEHSE